MPSASFCCGGNSPQVHRVRGGRLNLERCAKNFFVFSVHAGRDERREDDGGLTAMRDELAPSCRGNGGLKERNRFMPLMSPKSSLAALRSEAVKSSLNQEQ